MRGDHKTATYDLSCFKMSCLLFLSKLRDRLIDIYIGCFIKEIPSELQVEFYYSTFFTVLIKITKKEMIY